MAKELQGASLARDEQTVGRVVTGKVAGGGGRPTLRSHTDHCEDFDFDSGGDGELLRSSEQRSAVI